MEQHGNHRKRHSLAVLFHALLVSPGVLPADTKNQLLDKIRSYSAQPSEQRDNSVPQELERICLTALTRRPFERDLIVRGFGEDLLGFLARVPCPRYSVGMRGTTSHASGRMPTEYRGHGTHAKTPPVTNSGADLQLDNESMAWFHELGELLASDALDLQANPQTEGPAFYQGSLASHEGRLLLATRRDGPGGAEIHISLLTSELQVRDTWQVDCWHPSAAIGQEDPRLFLYRGQLHISFHGLSHDADGEWRSQMLLARLSADGRRAEHVWQPAYDQAQDWEKNWGFFEADDGSLCCVYSIDPHVVLQVDGERAREISRTEPGLRWDYGLLRGGAPPVRVGDEFYHWFHGACLEPFRYYALSVYTFSAHHPFRVTRFAARPLLDPLLHPREKPNLLPGGAILHDGRWLVSYGDNDVRSRIAEFDFESVERALQPVPAGS